MKKIYTQTILAFLLVTGASAQTIIFNEDFQGNNGMPANFTLFNVDNLTPAAAVNYVNGAWIAREDFVLPDPNDTMAVSTSWYTPAGQSDDWMWTPAINLTSNNFLNWEAMAPDAAYPDGYEVRILTTAPTTGNIASSAILLTVPAELQAWTSHTVDLQLAGYANQTVYIGFRNISTDMFLLFVDDISVVAPVGFDASMTATTPMNEYSRIPVSQAHPISFGGTFMNNGSSTITNVAATATVYNSSSTVVNTSSSTPVGSLAPLATSNFTAPSFTPTSVGFYRTDYSVSMTETDGAPANNLLAGGDTLWITDTVYARDRGTKIGALGIGAGNGGYLGQEYVLTQAGNLTSISGYVSRPYPSYNIAFAVFSKNGLPGATPIASTGTMTLTADTNDIWVTLPIIGGPFALPADTFVICIVEVDSTATLAQSSDNYTPATTWVNWPTNPMGNWAHNEDFSASFAHSYMLRANFGQFVDVNTVAENKLDASLYPNPNEGSFSLNLTMDQASDLDILVFDALGQQVYSKHLEKQSTGVVGFDLNLSNGMYFMQIVSAQGVTTLPVVIKK